MRIKVHRVLTVLVLLSIAATPLPRALLAPPSAHAAAATPASLAAARILNRFPGVHAADGIAAASALPAHAPAGLEPTADAGPDQAVQEGTTVQLDGTASEGRTTIFEPSSTEGALPGGTALSLALTGLGEPDGSGYQPLGGTISLGEAAPTPSMALAYVLDLSGSTLDLDGCGEDQNGDNRYNTILDCEVAAAKAVNDEAVLNGTVAEVSVVVFASGGVAADVSPLAGIQLLTGPDTDAGGLPGRDVDEVLSSVFVNAGVNKFTFRYAGAGTNYSAGLAAACNALANATVPNRIAVFLSDGENLLGSHVGTVLPCAQPVTFHAFAIGTGATCESDPTNRGSLQDIATLTGGTCTEVPDVSSLPDILPDVIAAELLRLELSIDGAPPVDISDQVDPPLPQASPVSLDLDYPIAQLGPGNHEICLTATGRDAGGQGSVTTCAQVVEGSGALTFLWRLISGVGPPVQLSSATSPQPTFLAIDDGRYTFELTVTDSFGLSASDRVTVDVTNVDPALSAQGREAFAGGVTLVTASFTDVGWLDTHQATFDWGDGSPPEIVPIPAQGAGWGGFFGSHIFGSAGAYQVTVTLEDDDGGMATASLVVEAEDAAAVWANSQTASRTLAWVGGTGSIQGLVHTNNELYVRGATKSVAGPTGYVGSADFKAGTHTFNPAPVQVPVADYPIRFDVADYRPGGPVAVQVGAAYHDRSDACASSGKWHVNQEVLPGGVYYVPCDVELNGSNIGGRITLAAEGSIKVAGSRPAFEPYYDGLLFLSGAGGDMAIDVSASASRFLGFLFSELGQIDVSGNDNSFFCGLLADRISLSGSELSVRGSSCGRPSSTVALPLLVPSLELALQVDRDTTLPGQSIGYDLVATHAGALLVVPGVLGLENVNGAPATVKSYAYVLEYFSLADQAWLPLASAAAAAGGYTPAEPLPAIGGLELSARPNPYAGVTYPAAGDPILNTVLDPGGFATWGYQALVNLTPGQVNLLLDADQVGGIRNRVDFELEPASVQVRRLFRFGTDFVDELRALSGDIVEAEILFSPPAGDLRPITSAEEASLGLLLPGDSVTVSQAYQVPVIEGRRPVEPDDGYRARLLAHDGAQLYGSAYARATGGVGLLVAPQAFAATTEQVPVVTIAKAGPAGGDAGGQIDWNIRLGNVGSAQALDLALVDELEGSPLPVAGAPETLQPAQVANASVVYGVPDDQPGGEIVNVATVTWFDGAGNAYGPVSSAATTAIASAPELRASLVDSLAVDNDDNGLITPGDVILYEAQVSNAGGSALTGIVLTVPVDAQTTIVPGSVSTSQGSVSSGNSPGDVTVRVDAGTLPAGDVVTVSWQVNVANPLAEGTNTLTVQGQVTSNELPAVLTDDPALPGAADATVTLVIVPAPVVGFTLQAGLLADPDGNGVVSPGDTVRYRADIRNTGGIAATGVLVMLPPDENTTLVAGSATASLGTVVTGNGAGDSFVEVDMGALAISAEATIHFDVTVDVPFPSGAEAVEVQGWLTSNELDPLLSDDPSTAAETDATALSVLSSTGGGGGGGTGGPAPSIGEVTPADGTIATEPVHISAELTPPEGETVAGWRVTYRRADSDQALELASGTGTTVDAILDPTLLANGTYIVAVEAEASGGGVSVGEISVVVDGQLKLGRFILTFQDMTVGLGGLVLDVLRTYDSYDRGLGDFGYGWTVDIADFRVAVNKPLGLGDWREEVVSCGLIFCTLRYVADKPHFVTVTWPNGTTEIFDLTPAYGSTFFRGLTAAEFTARPGSTSRLEALDTSLFYIGDGNLYGGPFGIDGVYDPQRFRLTDRFGTQYILDRTEGLLSMTDTAGNTLTFGDDGVISSRGGSLQFTRDGAGRITQITEPSGSVHNYSYDANGDLAGHTDPEGNTTQFLYNGDHGLLEVVDAQGIRAVRSEYDAAGRLIATVDADGNRVEYGHDVDARQEVITDRLGRVTVLSYDAAGNVIAKTDALGNVTTYTYDEDDNLLSETDPLGNTTTYTYDDQRNLLTRTDPLGNTTAFTYDATGRLLSATDPLGNAVALTYDAYGLPLTATNALGHAASQTYDARGDVLSTTDSLGNTTTYEYGADGNLARTVDALGHATTYTHDSNGRLLAWSSSRTDELGNLVTMTSASAYDDNGLLIETVDPDGYSTIYEYDAVGQRTALVDKNGNRSEFEYDALGNLVRTTYADGTQESATYDAEGNRISFTDRGGRTTTYEYDALNRLVRTVFPDGSVQSTEYDPAGRVIARTDENGNRTTYTYDAAGRLTVQTDALGNTTIFAYDGTGNLTGLTDARGNTTAFEYDALGRLTRTIFPDGSVSTAAYDPLGRLTAETDQAGNTTQFQYDALGRLIGVVDALGNWTTYAYDQVGNLVSETDPNGNTTRWAYDNLGRTVKQTLPLGMAESFTYDPNGNVLAHSNFNGQTTTFTYDTRDRLVQKQYPDSALVAFAYTATGLREAVVDAWGTTSYTYDARDRLTQVVNPDGSTLAYTYDGAGNRTSLAVPSGTTIYTYDVLNRLSAVTDPDGGVTSYTYDAAGNLVGVAYPNGSVASYTYDSLNRLVQLQNRDSGGGVITGHAYTLDAAGHRLGVVEQPGRRVDWTYDALYRLVGEDIVDPVFGNETIAHTYDPAGNRLTRTDSGGTVAYTYDANNRLLAAGSATFTYDDNGNLLSQSDGASTTAYGYDFEDRLTSAQTGADNVSYGYDADGVRVRSTAGGVAIHYLVDGNQRLAQVVEERAGDGTLLARYVHGHDLVSQARVGSPSYYHYDGLGSTRALTDLGQNVTDSYAYEGFGALLGATGSTPNNYLFAGEQFDPNVDAYYLRARYYLPALGRFLTRDNFEFPLADPVEHNRYSYARNSPANYTDPCGKAVAVEYALVQKQVTIRVTPQVVALGIAVACLYWKAATAVMVAAGASAAQIDAVPAPAPCKVKPPGDCTPQEHRMLQNAVNAACKIKRACNGAQDCATLIANQAKNLACAAARDLINTRCFRGGDDGHRQAANDARKAAAKCATLIAQKCTGP